MVSCEKLIQEISNYLDGDLAEDIKQAIEEHLEACAHCSVVLNTNAQDH